jgi:GNAT superfamily N-acetyltransferase
VPQSTSNSPRQVRYNQYQVTIEKDRWRLTKKIRGFMISIPSTQVTASLRSLFHSADPQAPRCFAVLDGVVKNGKILADNLDNPQWAIVQEGFDNSIFLGGRIDSVAIAEVFTALRQEGEVLVGMWEDDPRLGFLPSSPTYDGRTLEFYDRPLGSGLESFLRQVPPDCEIHRLDRDLILRTEWGPGDVKFAGGLDNWEKSCFGYCLMRGDEILSEATVGPPALGCYEPGVFTHPDHRNKGYGTMVVARLIQEIEAKGGQSYWNCSKQNAASAAIARKLGYRIEKEYRCMAWKQSDTEN